MKSARGSCDVAYVMTLDAEPPGVQRQRASALLRRLLDARFGAGTGRLDVTASGQPIVVDLAQAAFVSVTHTGRLVAAALADVAIGIDAEPVERTPTHPRLYARVCSPTELQWFEKLPEPARNQGFLRLWTRKEAYGKAIGVGIGFDLRSTDFHADDGGLRGVRGEWLAHNVDLGPDVVAVVVAEGACDIQVTKVDQWAVADLG